jgi:hypothetical protein
MSRDTDTRILLREKLAVDEWLNSNKLFHIMRDHPHHNFKILGGMFGTRKIPIINSWSSIMSNYKQMSEKNYDQDFLSDHIYDAIKDNSLIHASFNSYEEHTINFPIEYDNEYRFVGEYVYSDDSRSIIHIEDLKKSINNKNNLKIHYITSFYVINNDDNISIQRNNELLECLYKNMNGIIIAVNSDIMLDESIEKLKYSTIFLPSHKKSMITLLRYEYTDDYVPFDTNCSQSKLFGPRGDSQDTWIIHSRNNIPKQYRDLFDFQFGIPGCDNKCVFLFHFLNYDIYNDPLTIKTYHFHKSKQRNYTISYEYHTTSYVNHTKSYENHTK